MRAKTNLSLAFSVIASLAVASAFAASGKLLDGFEANDWGTSNGEGATVKTMNVPGKVGQALQVDYDLKDSKQWVQISKDISIESIEGQAIQFYMKVAGDKTNNLEVKLVDADGTTYGAKRPLKATKDWQLVTIQPLEFSYFWGGNDKILQGVTQVSFAIGNVEGGAGTVTLDELNLASNVKMAKIKSGMIDNCDSDEGWQTEAEKGATASVVSVPGKKKKAVALEYDLGTGKWVQLFKMFPLELTDKSVIIFMTKVSGAQNNIEVKLVDFDGSTFGVKLGKLEKKDDWYEIKIPISKFSYWWGGDKVLDMKNIKGIWIAVNRATGGKGSMAIDELRLE